MRSTTGEPMKYNSFWMTYSNLENKHFLPLAEFADGIESNVKARMISIGIHPDPISKGSIEQRSKTMDWYLEQRLGNTEEVEIAKCLVAHKFAFLTDLQSLMVTLKCLADDMSPKVLSHLEDAEKNLKSQMPGEVSYPYVLTQNAGKNLMGIIDSTLLVLERQMRIGNLRPDFYKTLPGRPATDDVLSFLAVQEYDLNKAAQKMIKDDPKIEWEVVQGVS